MMFNFKYLISYISTFTTLKPGDVIRKINNLRIKNFEDFRNAIASGLYLRDVVLLVQRERHRAFVTLRLQN